MLVILVTSILSSVPGSTIKGAVAPVLIPLARVTGLDQGWGMFAPNPPRSLSEIEVHVIMSNGSDRVWRPYTEDSNDDSMRKMQWRKFKEEIVNKPEYRPELALWVVRKMATETDRPVRVVMIAEITSLPPLGKDPKVSRKLLLDQRVPAALLGAQK
jgi:hypothetical protein